MVVEHKHIVKRTIWVAQCNCDHNEPWRRTSTEEIRESRCPKCGTWIPYKEESSVSTEYKKNLLLES